MYFNLLYYTIIIFTYFISLSTSINQEGWVDPHDMSPSKEYLKYTNNPSSLHKPAKTSDQKAEIYYKRTINMLLNSVHEDVNELDIYSGYLYFKINREEYERLKNYAEKHDGDLFEVNHILEQILTKPSHQHIQEFLETWFHKFLNVAFSRPGIISIILLSYFFVVYQMIRARYNLRYILSLLFINIFIYDFIFTWIHLYQKHEIDAMVSRMKFAEIPPECDPKNMDSWRFLWNAFRVEDDCEKYHHANYQDIFWKVSPGAVLTDIFARTIEKPGTAFGNAFANICAAVYNKFPWPMNIIIFPFAMVFFCLMATITLSVVFKRDIKFNFFHLFSISNSVAHQPSTSAETSGDRLTDKNVERLLRLAENQQQRIELVQITKVEPEKQKSIKKEEPEKQESIKNEKPEKLAIKEHFEENVVTTTTTDD